MTRNPYAPPESNVDGPTAVVPGSQSRVASGPLYSSNQVGVASFGGSPIAAAWFAASNFRAWRQPRRARQTMLWGFAATVVVLGISFVLPE